MAEQDSLSVGQDCEREVAHITYCRLCEAQCGLLATVKGGRITHVGPDRQHVASAGHLCVKGPAMLHVTYDPDRVLTPLKRTGAAGEFEPVSWNQALDDIAGRLSSIVKRYGPDSLGLYFGNPAAFSFGHFDFVAAFMRAFGASKIFNPLHVDSGAKSLGCALVFGPGGGFTFPDLEHTDFLLILGANPLVSHLSIVTEPRALQKLEAVARRGGVVVVDPRRTETAKRFEHLPVPPDSDVWLLAAMLNTIFDEGLAREALLDERVEGWRTLREALAAIPMEAAVVRCQLSAEQIRNLTLRFATTPRAACYGRIGTCRGTYATLTNVLIEALNIVTGRFGQVGGWITGRSPFSANAPPQSTNRLEEVPSPYGDERSRIGAFPLIRGFQPGGGLAQEILTSGPGQVRALILDSGNPVLAYPGSRRTDKALSELELLVALDFYVTESTRHAHYILPALTFFERADVNDLFVANAPRPWLQYTDPVIAPLGESRLELEVYHELLLRTGRPGLFPSGEVSAEAALARMIDDLLGKASIGHGIGALTVARMRDEFSSGLSLGESDAEGSWKRVAYADGRPRLWGEIIAGELVRLRAAMDAPEDPRLKLFGRRTIRSLNSWMHNDLRIVRSERPTLIMHPMDAADRAIGDGECVRLSSDFGQIEVDVEISEDVIRGSVSYPHGWGHAGGWQVANNLRGGNVNELTSGDPEDWEQVSGVCRLDGLPVEVSPTRQAPFAR